jgi:hypothetical protein
MRSLNSAAALLVLANSLSFAELKIDSPQHADVPAEKARVLLRLAVRSVAKEFHLREPSKEEFDLHLVLGEKDERYELDEQSGVPILYLQQWNEAKFVTAAIRLAVQKSIDRRRQDQMVTDILQRSQQIVAIPANKLRGADLPATRPLRRDEQPCLTGIRDASEKEVLCDPLRPWPPRR